MSAVAVIWSIDVLRLLIAILPLVVLPVGNIDAGGVRLLEVEAPKLPANHLKDVENNFWNDLGNWPLFITDGKLIYERRIYVVHNREVRDEVDSSEQVVSQGAPYEAYYEIRANEVDELLDGDQVHPALSVGYGPSFVWNGNDKIVLRRFLYLTFSEVHYYDLDGRKTRSWYTNYINNRYVEIVYSNNDHIAFAEGPAFDDRDYYGRTIAVIEGREVSNSEFIALFRTREGSKTDGDTRLNIK